MDAENSKQSVGRNMQESKQSITPSSGTLLQDLRDIILKGRAMAYAAAGAVLLDTYWNLGRRIVEEEQNGSKRAEYGTQSLESLAIKLMEEFGKGFDARRLRSYRQFYLYFPKVEIWHSRVPNLTWTHFRELLRVDDEKARLWYMEEASQESMERAHIVPQYQFAILPAASCIAAEGACCGGDETHNRSISG